MAERALDPADAAGRAPTSGAVTSPGARPGPWSSSSTVSSCSTSKGVTKTLLTSSEDPDLLRAAAGTRGCRAPRQPRTHITVEKADGGRLLGSDHPVVPALEQAGFHLTPRGLRMRR